MNTETLDKYFIIYSNKIEFNGCILSFRKKLLFNISNTPKLILQHNNNGSIGWWVKGLWLSISKAKELIRHEEVKVDVSCLQWYIQCELEDCFNIDRA